MQAAYDVSGRVVLVGDKVAYGHDNGSTLELGLVYKITEKKVWVHPICKEEKKVYRNINQCRDWSRVSKVGV